MGKLQRGVNDLYTWCLNNGEFGQQLMSEWQGIDENNRSISITDATRASRTKVLWKCSQGHTWIANVNSRTSTKCKCRLCAYKEQGEMQSKMAVKPSINDLYTWSLRNGEWGKRLIDEWEGIDENDQPILMSSIAKSSTKRVKWMCNQGHEWKARISDRVCHRSDCPICKAELHSEICMQSRLNQGLNDLCSWCLSNGEWGKQLMSEWTGLDENNQPISIESITRASNKKVKWKCSQGHEWYATVVSRTIGRGCPYCTGILVSNQNSLENWCSNNGAWGQKLLKEWVGLDENNQPIYIDKVSRGSYKKVKWKCNQGHEWYAIVLSRTKDKTSCPYCNSHGTSYPEQYLYNALKQLYPKAENRCKVLKSSEHPQGIEFDIGIPEIPLCIEYSPTYWHDGREEMDEYKKQICNQHKVRLIQIVEDSYHELDFKMGNNYICFRMNQAKRTEIIQVILAHILKTINHSIDEIDLEKVEQDTRKRLTATYSVR